MNALRSLVPLLPVRRVPASIAFYEKLGFRVGNTFVPPDETEPSWAWLASENGAQLMVGRAESAARPFEELLLYVYVDDVEAKRSELVSAGIEAGEIARPFYAPRGEFRIVDPDGYGLMITHT